MKFFKVIIGLAVVALLGMLYWSSHLIELEVKSLRNEMRQIQGARISIAQPVARMRSLVDASLPNILQPDPYYEKTLPQLLGPDFVPHGTFRAATAGRPENLHPMAGWGTVIKIFEACTGAVGAQRVGQYEEFSPDLAFKVEHRNPGEYWVHLRDDIYWQPLDPSHFPDSFELAPHFLQRHPVTAHDFKFWFDVVMNPYVQEAGATSLRNYLYDIEEFRVVDDKTFVVRWATRDVGGEQRAKYIAQGWTAGLRPLASFVYQYFSDGTKIVDEDDYRTNSVWAQNFSQHWAKNIVPSCGGWLFDGYTDREIRFKRNPDYPYPYKILGEERVVYFKESPDAIWQAFKAGEIDYFETGMAPEKLIELDQFEKTQAYASQPPIDRMSYSASAYQYIGWNFNRPYFKSKEVRKALTMAIDRRRIISQNMHGLGVELTGPLLPSDPAYDPTLDAWPYDPQQARRLLTKAGWIDEDGDGILDKEIDGKRIPFRFRLVYYVGSVQARHTVDYIATALRDVGVDCQPYGLDVADLTLAVEGKDFDGLYLLWGNIQPPSEPKQLWHSSGAKEKGSSNHIGFANAQVDQLIDELQYEYNPERRLELYRQFHQIIHEEEPYTFLAVPQAVFLYRDYLKNVWIPSERQDLVPGAVVSEPSLSLFYLEQ